jgi:hypothetical protein
MRKRWKFILPAIGLSLFAVLTYHSVLENRQTKDSGGDYFRWEWIPLNSDPLGKNPPAPKKCENGEANCISWALEPDGSILEGWTYCLSYPHFPLAFSVQSLSRVLAI